MSPKTKREVRRLLDRGGMSQMEVANRLHLTYSEVNEVFRERATERHENKPLGAIPTEAEATRCAGCGLMVYVWPCLQCEREAKRQRMRWKR